MDNQKKLLEYQEKLKGSKAEEILRFAASEFSGQITFASSLGEEDQVLTDMIARVAPPIEIFTLDTGRLFQETYDLLAKTQKKYKLDYKVYYPDTTAVEKMIAEKGINLFYESVENRKLCCQVRKVDPLRRALSGKRAWITGLRRAQSLTRTSMDVIEWDAANNLFKINPLCHWSLDDVRTYISRNAVDVNPLHVQGFVSIGCAPCTRAIKEGDDIRSGRWWWENPEQKECGLHRPSDKK